MAKMVVKRQKDVRTPKVFMHRVADIRGGVSVKTSEVGGDYVKEGAILSAPDNGICHVVKVAELTAELGAEATEIRCKKYHGFKVGNFVMAKSKGKAYAITKIDYTSKDYDIITIATAIGEIKQGGFIMEAAAQSTSTTSKLKYEPFALVGTGKTFGPGENMDTDAWLIGVTQGNPLPAEIAEKLTGIINY